MKKLLNVPYFSQWDSDASNSKNDCGPTCVSMILGYYGINATSDEVFEKTGAGSGVISIAELKNAIDDYQLKSRYEKDRNWQRIKDLIDSKIPPIALIHYGDLSSRQDKGYSGGHFLVITGYRDDGVFANDPDFWGNYRSDGKNHFYKKDEFLEAWNNSYQDQNPRNSLLIIKEKESQSEALNECLAQHTHLVDENKKLKSKKEESEKKLVKAKKKIADLEPRAEKWDKVEETQGFKNFVELDDFIRSLKDSTDCSGVIKKKNKECVKKIEQVEEKYESKLKHIRKMWKEDSEKSKKLVNPTQLTKIELIGLFLGVNFETYQQLDNQEHLDSRKDDLEES